MASRRSARLSGARVKYTDDPFEAAGLSVESEDNSSDQPPKRKGKGRKRQDDSSDEDFAELELGEEDVEQADEISEYEDDEGAFSPAAANELDESSEIFGDNEEDEAFVMRSRYNKKRRPDGTVAIQRDEIHNRGIWNPTEHVSKSMHMKLTFGTDDRDLLAMIYARDRFFQGINSTLPTRTSLDGAESMPGYGPGKTFGVAPEDMETEATTGWDWYYDDNSGGRFRKRQRIETINEEEAHRRYLPRPQKKEHTVIIGPVDNQKVFHLQQNESLDFGEAWNGVRPRKKKAGKRKGEPPEDAAEAEEDPGRGSAANQQRTREGWILNMGGKVQCLAWAPNQDGDTQYLAIAVPISEQQKREQPVEEPSGAPAFTPSGPYPAALQIWSFEASKDEGLTKTLDMSRKPVLQMVICTDWGDIRRIAWCPMARRRRDEDDADGLHNLGLLAGIWGDGAVRVLDIKLNSGSDRTEFYRVQSAAFSCKPPSTVFACLTWLSPSDIAVACANGFVGIWNLVSSEPTQDPVPYMYFPVHSTYITGISSAYPTHPHLLGTTSMDGQTRLTSILDPQKDVVETSRIRLGSMHIAYSPCLQAFFSNDENDCIRSLAVRRFYTTTTVGRLPSTVTAMASSSFWHPSGLFGCTRGSVFAINPMRRLLHSKEKNWHLTWFTHEWARGAGAGEPDVSRFLDGFRAESVSLSRADKLVINGVMAITIYDDENHITALSWNPNQRCAGWASAGMGSGLVRVEDLAI